MSTDPPKGHSGIIFQNYFFSQQRHSSSKTSSVHCTHTHTHPLHVVTHYKLMCHSRNHKYDYNTAMATATNTATATANAMSSHVVTTSSVYYMIHNAGS